jgi:ribosomal protein S12 methylthiotransferase accessory factor
VAGHGLIVLPLFLNIPTTISSLTTNPIERSYSLQFAEAALTSELDKLGYTYEFKIVGEFIYTAQCIIKDKKSGLSMASGNGKGELIESRVGSLFEATEHLFSGYEFIKSDKIKYLRSLDFCRENNMCDALPLAIIREEKNATLPFLEYKAVNGIKTCFYPLALSCPSYFDSLIENGDLREMDSFNYKRLENYSNNSGTAIGMNSEEAIIHGLLEGIERTSLSEFLAKIFLLNDGKYLRVINNITLPDNIKDVVSRTEKELSSTVFIFEMPNKFGIPAYCTWMEQYDYNIGIVGYGCSLSVEHAILRSLYEVAQFYLLTKHIHGFDWLKTTSEGHLTQLEGLPFHQDCAKFNLGIKCKALGFDLINYNDLAQPQFSKDPKVYLSQLTDIIYANGEIPFASELNIIGGGISITHTFITGEDRFFNVKNGRSAFPVSLEAN